MHFPSMTEKIFILLVDNVLAARKTFPSKTLVITSVLSYTVIHGIISLTGDGKLFHALVRRLSIFLNLISVIFMILRIFVAKWLSLSCTLNKFLTYSEKSSSCRILRDAKKRFSLFNLMFLMELDRSLRWVGGTRLFSYHGLWVYEAKLRKITYITLFLDYNDRNKV